LTILDSTLRPDDEPFAHRAEHWRQAMEEIRRQEAEIRLGGGDAAQEKQRSRGKMTARERVAALCDPDAPFLELGVWAAHGFYEEWGGAPAAGVVIGVGRVAGRETVVVANDATVKAGAWFPLTAKKVLRAQEIALENRLPIVYLVDSAGVFLPLQDEIFPDKEHFGRAFYNNARLSAEGVFQLAAIMGSCVAGGAYLPIMSDESHIVEGTGSIFLAGPHLVKAAIGEKVDRRRSAAPSCRRRLRRRRPPPPGRRHLPGHDAAPDRAARRPRARPLRPPRALRPAPPGRPALRRDARRSLAPLRHPRAPRPHARRLELDEFKATYGQTLVCGTGWIGGWAVGVVANQRSIVGAEARARAVRSASCRSAA
jgi:3-methylcrotonyl-CoA carboxylase beta subunit